MRNHCTKCKGRGYTGWTFTFAFLNKRKKCTHCCGTGFEPPPPKPTRLPSPSPPAFEDYRLNACTFSAQEMSLLKDILVQNAGDLIDRLKDSVSLSDREWKEFKEKLEV